MNSCDFELIEIVEKLREIPEHRELVDYILTGDCFALNGKFKKSKVYKHFGIAAYKLEAKMELLKEDALELLGG